MSKRKTRKEKLLADKRRNTTGYISLSEEKINIKNAVSSPRIYAQRAEGSDLRHVRADVFKTLLVTFFILLVQIILFASIKIKAISIPGLSY